VRPIELVRVLNNGATTEPFYVNPDHIVSFSIAWSAGSYLTLSAGGTYLVSETPEQIMSRLADHRSTMRAEEHDGIQVYR